MSDLWLMLEDTLVPIFVCVVLPVMCVWLTMSARKHEIDKKTGLAIKAIESGTEIDPNLFIKPRKTIKEKVFGRLIAGVILMSLGIASAVVALLVKDEDVLIPAAIFFGLGVALFVIYLVSKKQFADEIASDK